MEAYAVLATGGKQVLVKVGDTVEIEKIEAEEREATGIKTLRIGYNKVFGYYIEVSRSFTDQVPDYFISLV